LVRVAKPGQRMRAAMSSGFSASSRASILVIFTSTSFGSMPNRPLAIASRRVF